MKELITRKRMTDTDRREEEEELLRWRRSSAANEASKDTTDQD